MGTKTVPGTSASATTTSAYPQWEYDVITSLGGTVNEGKLKALNLIARLEGVPAGANNWMAITAPTTNLNMWGTVGSAPSVADYGQSGSAIAPGQWNSFDNNSISVTTYPTQSSGVKALVEFLSNGHPGIVAALKDPNATTTSVLTAIAKDGAWGGDPAKALAMTGQSGIYTGGAPTGKASQSSPAAGGGSSFYQCDSGNRLIGGLGINILNTCQAKALVGGALMATGVLLMAGGLTLLGVDIAKRGAAKEIGNAVANGLRRLPGIGRETVATGPTTEAPEVYEGRTLSPQQSAYRREKGDAALSEAFRRQDAAAQRRRQAQGQGFMPRGAA